MRSSSLSAVGQFRTVALWVAVAGAGCAGSAAGAGAQAAADGGPDLTTERGRSGETVVLLHGLGRTTRSMNPLESALAERGYRVVNIGYPSRRHSVAELTDSLRVELESCCREGTGPIHFVTHSLGGILVRSYAERYGTDRLGRVVMLSPPNHGSEVVDRLGGLELFGWLLGPAATEMGTDPASVPRRLGPVGFELAVITGDASLNPLFSWWLPGPDDGKVAVESARVEGTDAFLVVPYSHAFIMRRDQVIERTVAFLTTGSLRDAPPAPERRP